MDSLLLSAQGQDRVAQDDLCVWFSSLELLVFLVGATAGVKWFFMLILYKVHSCLRVFIRSLPSGSCVFSKLKEGSSLLALRTMYHAQQSLKSYGRRFGRCAINSRQYIQRYSQRVWVDTTLAWAVGSRQYSAGSTYIEADRHRKVCCASSPHAIEPVPSTPTSELDLFHYGCDKVHHRWATYLVGRIKFPCSATPRGKCPRGMHTQQCLAWPASSEVLRATLPIPSQ